MWFKNIQLFQFVGQCDLDLDALSAALAQKVFHPCPDHLPISSGWVAPFSGDADAPLVHVVEGCWLLCWQSEEKLLPASVVNHLFAEKLAMAEEQAGRKLKKQDRDALKESLIDSLLPRAFTKVQRTYAYIDTQKGWLVVNTSSMAKAEQFTQALRQALGSLKIQLPELQDISLIMTDWLLSNQYPPEFVISDGCVLQDQANGGVVRCQKQDLLASEIQTLIAANRQVRQLSLVWQDQIAFLLTEDFAIKSMKYLELVQDQASDIFTETDAQRFDADLSIMCLTVRGLVDGLLAVFTKPAAAVASEAAAESIVEA